MCACLLCGLVVEVSEGHCVCDWLLGVLLSCIVMWGVVMGLTGGDVCGT